MFLIKFDDRILPPADVEMRAVSQVSGALCAKPVIRLHAWDGSAMKAPSPAPSAPNLFRNIRRSKVQLML